MPARARAAISLGISFTDARYQRLAEDTGGVFPMRDFVAPTRIAVNAKHAPSWLRRCSGMTVFARPLSNVSSASGMHFTTSSRNRFRPALARLERQDIAAQEIRRRLNDLCGRHMPLGLSGAVHALAARRSRRIIQRPRQKFHQATAVLDIALVSQPLLRADAV
jgi:hypothetical protein